jgi:Esterase/lipase
MRTRHLTGLLCLALALSCSRSVEPGLYTAQGGFVRVFLDSLGNKKAVMYRDTSALWADTLAFDLKAQEKSLKPYHEPEFHLFPERELYREPAFKVGENRDIVYGRVVKNVDDDRERMDLKLDLFVPEDGARTARPLLVAFHGGAFQNGDKRDSSLVEWCRYFASLGYVVSSVDYRQGYRRNEKETDEAMFRALKDANAAVRFLLKRDSLLIHSDRIFAAGADAGAVTAMNLAFMRDENMPVVMTERGDSLIASRQQLLRGFDIRAVANLWGAVPDTAILRNAKIPVISFQSKEDAEIPFWTGRPSNGKTRSRMTASTFSVPSSSPSCRSSFLTWKGMSSGKCMARGWSPPGPEARRHRERTACLHGARHNLFLDDEGNIDFPVYDEIKEQTAAFFASRMVVAPVSLRQDAEDPQLFIIDNTEVETCLWKVEGGVLVGKGDDAARILLFPDAPVHSVSVSGEYLSGETFNETIEL